jgi:hypothetical protein
MNYIEIFKKYWLFITVTILVFLIFSTLVLLNLTKPTPSIKPTISPKPATTYNPVGTSAPIASLSPSTPTQIKRPETGTDYQVITPKEEQKIDQDNAVGQLIKKLPYQSANFSLEYEFSTNKFTLTLNQNNLTAANNEFDQFLKDNSIQNRNWLYNLRTK